MPLKVESWPPVVVWANWVQFAPGQRIVQTRRQSRMLLWCRQGAGTLKTHGPGFDLIPGRWLLLPWGTPMVYQAHPQAPFLLAGVHWIPRHDPAAAVIFDVAHANEGPLSNLPSRRDAPLADWDNQILQGDVSHAESLIALAEYLVARFNTARPAAGDVPAMRNLAALLVEEIQRVIAQVSSTATPASPRLQAARQYAALHLAEPLDIARLAGAAQCSRATLARLFRREMRTSPAAWLARLRLERARHLLRSSPLPIHRIAHRIGLEDPYYFSRFFRRHMGVSPRQYRATTRPL